MLHLAPFWCASYPNNKEKLIEPNTDVLCCGRQSHVDYLIVIMSCICSVLLSFSMLSLKFATFWYSLPVMNEFWESSVEQSDYS